MSEHILLMSQLGLKEKTSILNANMPHLYIEHKIEDQWLQLKGPSESDCTN